jgi:hypothetical protein
VEGAIGANLALGAWKKATANHLRPRTKHMKSIAFGLLLVAWTALPGPAHLAAQDPQPRHLTASLGLLQYDFTATGLAPMLAIRGTTPISSVMVLEAGIVGSRPQQQMGSVSTFLAPEAQLQLALPFVAFVPYMGLGLGAVMDLREAELGGSHTNMTISGSLGVRTWFGGRAGLQVEFRGRGIGLDFEDSSAEYTAGLAWRI